MALIKCPKCGKEVSDAAVVCSVCGCRIELYTKWIREQKLDSIPMPEHPKKEKGWLILLGILVLGVLTLIPFYTLEPENSAGITFMLFAELLCMPILIYIRERNYQRQMENYYLALRDFEAYKRKIVLEQMLKK